MNFIQMRCFVLYCFIVNYYLKKQLFRRVTNTHFEQLYLCTILLIFILSFTASNLCCPWPRLLGDPCVGGSVSSRAVRHRRPRGVLCHVSWH